MKYHSKEEKTVTVAIIAIIAALALLGLVMVLVANNLALQEAEAGCERGKAGSHAFNQSKGRCFDRGTF
jgi:type II secretory pathway pseudopilin PulG